MSTTLHFVPLDRISVEQDFNPRHDFDGLDVLVESVKAQGILQPILLRPEADNRYVVVAGERRFRAAGLAGLTEVPALVNDSSNGVTFTQALAENLNRQDLNPVEEALAYADVTAAPQSDRQGWIRGLDSAAWGDQYASGEPPVSKAVAKVAAKVLPASVKDALAAKVAERDRIDPPDLGDDEDASMDGDDA